MKKGFGGIVLDTAFRIIVPFSLVYGVYVLIFGEAGRAVAFRPARCSRSGSFCPGSLWGSMLLSMFRARMP